MSYARKAMWMRMSESGFVRFDAVKNDGVVVNLSRCDVSIKTNNSFEERFFLPAVFARPAQSISCPDVTGRNGRPRISFTEAEFLQNSSTSLSGTFVSRPDCSSNFLTLLRTSSISERALLL